MNLRSLCIVLPLLLGAADAQIVTDGLRDAAYGSPVAVQHNPTGYGDNTNPDPLAANGSELDAAHAVIRDGKLHILFTGNLETNFNKLSIFIDSRPGGQNVLANDNPDVDFNGLNNLAGLKFDEDFEADFFFTIGGGGDPIEFFANYAELGNPGVGTYLGGTGSPNAGFPVNLANGVQVGIDNSNTGGVTDSDASAAASVTTGIEFSIPLALIGNPTAQVRVCAFISNPSHDSLSNQVLGSLPAGYGNLASPSTVDFSDETNLPVTVFFWPRWQVTTAADSGAGSLRQTIADAPAFSAIVFDPALAGQTITLGGTAMVINKALTISGFDLRPGITLDANQASRVFHLTSTGSLILRGLTLTGGNGTGTPASGFGGAILTQGNLFVSHCLFTGNSATLDGGAISGDCAVNNSTFVGNTARTGAAVVLGFGSLDHCTITHNKVTAKDSGAVGAVVGFEGKTFIDNCIITDNASDFDVVVDGFNEPGEVVFGGRNIVGSRDISYGSFSGPSPLTDSPLLAPLGDYGGPSRTMPPLPGSPAIDAALPAFFNTPDDQRGEIRTPGVSDIGAVEYQGTADLVTFWPLDWDGDGIPFGIERALGNDPFLADPNEEGNLTVPQFNPSGQATLRFRIGDDARADTIWILQRSTTLLPGSWQEIYRYDGPAFQGTTQPDIATLWTTTITPNTTFAHVTDLNPPPGKAFYRFVAEVAP